MGHTCLVLPSTKALSINIGIIMPTLHNMTKGSGLDIFKLRYVFRVIAGIW